MTKRQWKENRLESVSPFLFMISFLFDRKMVVCVACAWFLLSREIVSPTPSIATLGILSQTYTLYLRGGMAKSKASNIQGKEKVAEVQNVKSVEM